jgi:FlaA1/EpsC-like NDP-sugar epimerase
MMELSLLNRDRSYFEQDYAENLALIEDMIKGSSILVIGAAGTIGQAVTKELFYLSPAKLHAIDISENNLVELVRDIRSSVGYLTPDFQTFALDIGSEEFDLFIKDQTRYDYIFNLSALKHVRSEQNKFTLLRMLKVNIFNTVKIAKYAREMGVRKYFCVSTDKAANPVNMMGASKRIMELFLNRESRHCDISGARFANVAFSDGSLLAGFAHRIEKRQPISAPRDIKRYFVTKTEAGRICVLSALLGGNKDIFFPKLQAAKHQITFSEIATRYLQALGRTPKICMSEDEARSFEFSNNSEEWPCYFFDSDTTGEKPFEEFYTITEKVDLDRFIDVGVVNSSFVVEDSMLDYFESSVGEMLKSNHFDKNDLVKLFQEILPNFQHEEKGKYLDQKM